MQERVMVSAVWVAVWVGPMLLGCTSGPGTTNHAGQAGSGGSATTLNGLSFSEAPSATQTFYWGDVLVSAPGFADPGAPGRDTMTIALDAQNRLRFVALNAAPSLGESFGDGPYDFPLTGTKHSDLLPGFDVTAEATPASTASHFQTRVHILDSDCRDDAFETIEGTSVDGGWSIDYSLTGRWNTLPWIQRAHGALYASGPHVVAPPAGRPSDWAGPVELMNPDFPDQPVDHMTLTLDAAGSPQKFAFGRFGVGATIGPRAADFQLEGLDHSDEITITFDDADPPTATHFVVRYHVRSVESGVDYTQGFEGTRTGNALAVRHFTKGTFFGQAVDAHAAGILAPLSAGGVPDPIDPGGSGSGGVSGTAGTGATNCVGGTGGVGTGGMGGSSAPPPACSPGVTNHGSCGEPGRICVTSTTRCSCGYDPTANGDDLFWLCGALN